MIASLAMIVIVITSLGMLSVNTIRNTINNRGRNFMRASVDMIASVLDQDYDDLLQTSQYMLPSNRIGQDYLHVLNASDSFNLGEAKRNLMRDASMLTFSGRRSTIAAYCSPDASEVLFSTMPLQETASIASPSNPIYTAQGITYQSFHKFHWSVNKYIVICC